MKIRYLICALFCLALPGAAFAADEADAVPEPKTIALMFYADWCGTCKALDPKVEAARQEIGEEPVLFLKLDHTNATTTRQAAMLAQSLGLQEVYAEMGGKTGFVLLVDAEDKKPVGRITREHSEAQIAQALRRSVQ